MGRDSIPKTQHLGMPSCVSPVYKMCLSQCFSGRPKGQERLGCGSSATATLIDRRFLPVLLAAANMRSFLSHSQSAKWSRSNVRRQLPAHSTPRKFSRSIVRAIQSQ